MNDYKSADEHWEDRPELAACSDDERYRLLAAERRRVVLDVLADREAPIGLEALATAVAGRVSDVESPGAEETEQAMISLHHQHLPVMADVGAIEYDPDAKVVESRGGKTRSPDGAGRRQ
jgi:hypothetical protein